MRAVIIAAALPAQMPLLGARYPSALLPCVDRPVVQVILEYLIPRGVQQFDIVICEGAAEIEAALGTGARWGCAITYHLCRDCAYPYEILARPTPDAAPYLLADVTSLPQLPEHLATWDAPPTVWQIGDGAQAAWSGWGMLPGTFHPPDAPTWDATALQTAISAHCDTEWQQVHVNGLTFDTYAGLLAAAQASIAGSFPGVEPRARQNDPQVWIGHNVVLPPNCEIMPPVYIGNDCRIGQDVTLGPGTIIEHRCIIDRNAAITGSMLCAESYFGEGLEATAVIIDKNALINVPLHAETTVREAFILGGVRDTARGGVRSLLSRIEGVCLSLSAAPLVMLLALARWLLKRPVRYAHQYAVTPTSPGDMRRREWTLHTFSPHPERERGLRKFFYVTLPSLPQVARGNLRIVGLPMRSWRAIEDLPPDWRALSLQAYPGLVTADAIYTGTAASDDERYAAEAYYVARSNWWRDLRLLLTALWRMVLVRTNDNRM